MPAETSGTGMFLTLPSEDKIKGRSILETYGVFIY
jgi:hypothetical protein